MIWLHCLDDVTLATLTGCCDLVTGSSDLVTLTGCCDFGYTDLPTLTGGHDLVTLT